MNYSYQNRNKIIILIFCFIFIIIFFQLFNLQILSKEYKMAAENNSIFRKSIYPNRGIIYDRNKKSLLENVVSYDLLVTPSEMEDLDTALFCSFLNIKISDFRKKINELIYKNSSVKPSVFEAILSDKLYAQFYENLYKFPGFSLTERSIRYYPNNVGAHFLGYLAEVDSSLLKKNKTEGYELGDWVGVSGLEKYYEKILMGKKGVKRFIRDNKGRLQGNYENGKYDTIAVAGKNIYTGVDVGVQILAEKLLSNKIGSIVAINPTNGLIIAMASSPSYNPNLLIGINRRKAYYNMLFDTAKPLYNRAIKGQYPPGSTYKPLGGLISLAEKVITPSYGYNCSGAYYACGDPRNCEHKNFGHATNLTIALANSCNSYFLQLFRLTIDNNKYGNVKNGYINWKNYINNFGFGRVTEIDIPGESKGNIYTVEQYEKDLGKSKYWNSCNFLTLGIGQDRMTVTPLQLANLTAIIANKGFYYIPHFVDSMDNITNEEKKMLSKYKQKNVVNNLQPTDFEPIIEGMHEVTVFGTAAFIKIPGVEYAAKTGTAQNPHGNNHSIFICFAPLKNPKIAVAVIIENAGYGATWAGPIASFIVEKYLNDTISKENVPKINTITTKNLMPEEIRKWHNRKDSLNLYKINLNGFQIENIEAEMEDFIIPTKKNYNQLKDSSPKNKK